MLKEDKQNVFALIFRFGDSENVIQSFPIRPHTHVWFPIHTNLQLSLAAASDILSLVFRNYICIQLFVTPSVLGLVCFLPVRVIQD